MRLTLALGPLRLAVSTDRDTDVEVVDLTESSDDAGSSLDGGTTASMPMDAGLTAGFVVPEPED